MWKDVEIGVRDEDEQHLILGGLFGLFDQVCSWLIFDATGICHHVCNILIHYRY